jgi:hypothetical protein
MSSLLRERELRNSFPSSFVINSLDLERDLVLNEKQKYRQEIISPSEVSDFKNYVDTVFEDEVVNLKKRREEDFSKKRNIKWSWCGASETSEISEISDLNKLENKEKISVSQNFPDLNSFDPTQEGTYEGTLEESQWLENQEMIDDSEKYYYSNNICYPQYIPSEIKEKIDKNEISLKSKKLILSQNNEAQKSRIHRSPFITHREAIILKQLLESPLADSDCLKTLNYIHHISEEKSNLDLLFKAGIPYLISKLIHSMPDRKILLLDSTSINYRLLQSAIVALGSFLDRNLIEFFMIKPALHKILSILKSSHELEEHFLKFCLWILNFSSTNFTKKTVNLIIHHEMEKNLISYLKCSCENILLYSLRIIGDICTCNDSKTQKVLDEGLVKILKRFMTSPNVALRKDAVWIISNIAVGTQYQIQGLIEVDIFPILRNIISRDVTIIKKEAIWAICGLSNNKNPYHAEILIEQGIIEVLYGFLSNSNPRFIILSLEAIMNFLEIDNFFYRHSVEFQHKSVLKTKLIPLGFLETLDGLQYHHNQVVYERVSFIIDNYLSNCEDEDFQII